MSSRITLLLSAAFAAAMASSAVGQGLGYPEPPHYTASRAARYWFDDGYVARACTGRVGFMASDGCDAKPICSRCDYSRPRTCGCQAGHLDLIGGLVSWFDGGSCGKSCGCKSGPKIATQKGVTQKKVATQKIATQKCPTPKCVVQKSAPQKCVPQKISVQKLPTQKTCSKSCGGKLGCASRCRPSLLDSLAADIGALFQCGGSSKSKCGRCRPTPAKSKSMSGPIESYGTPMTLPVPSSDMEEGESSPEHDPSIPPDPSLGDGEVGTGTRSATRPRQLWRRSQSSESSMPRLLPADSARGIAPISYEELIESKAPQTLEIPSTSKRLDIFQAASNLDSVGQQPGPAPRKLPNDGTPLNPLRN